MASLRVLNLSRTQVFNLQLQVSDLVLLHQLDLSCSSIEISPKELKYLVTLKCLKLERTTFLRAIPPEVISNLKMLQVLRMFQCGSSSKKKLAFCLEVVNFW